MADQRLWDRLDHSQRLALDFIILECVRQRDEENWTKEHDAQHATGELALAAATYAYTSTLSREEAKAQKPYIGHETPPARLTIPQLWPWAREWFKPKSPYHDLKRAAALCVAEMARIQERALDRAEIT